MRHWVGAKWKAADVGLIKHINKDVYIILLWDMLFKLTFLVITGQLYKNKVYINFYIYLLYAHCFILWLMLSHIAIA